MLLRSFMLAVSCAVISSAAPPPLRGIAHVAYRVSDYAEGEVTDVENHDLYIDWMIASQQKLRRAIGAVMGGRPVREYDEVDGEDESGGDEEFERR